MDRADALRESQGRRDSFGYTLLASLIMDSPLAQNLYVVRPRFAMPVRRVMGPFEFAWQNKDEALRTQRRKERLFRVFFSGLSSPGFPLRSLR
jgi:hypothetical protein